MLELIDHPDGGKWTGKKMQDATNGELGPSYFTALRDGDIRIPRADKIEAIAKAMYFPPELWFKSLEWWQDLHSRWRGGEDVTVILYGEETEEQTTGISIADRLNHLFQIQINDDTGQPFTEEEVSHYSSGSVSVKDLKHMRDGMLDYNVSWSTLLVLCRVFDVAPSYWSGPTTPWRPSPGILQRLGDPDSVTTFQNSLDLSKDNRSMLRTLSDYLKRGQ